MRLLLLLLTLGATIIFWVQNQQPIILVFFGINKTLSLPIAAWVLLFAIAGMLTTWCVQFLIPVAKGSSAQPFKPAPPTAQPYSPPPPRPRNSPDESTPKRSSPRTVLQQSSTFTPPPKSQSDWDAGNLIDDWNLEEPAPEPAPKETAFASPYPEAPSFEVQRQPQVEVHEGSVYSYKYREPRDRTQSSADKTQHRQAGDREQIYDADYRLITPPYRESHEQKIEEDEDEDWI
jgi:hypothetical protein